MANNMVSNQNNDLNNIGSILKKKREELSYTLEHVSEITRITLSSLRNIEEGNMAALPGLVFVRGFIRNYAKLLGLESDWMIEALNQTFTSQDDRQTSSKKDSNSFSDEKEEVKSKTIYYAVAAAAVCIALVSIYTINQQPTDKLTLINESVETVQAIESVEAQTELVVNQVILSEEEKKVEEEPVEPAPTKVISPLTLTLVANQNDWIRLAIDGQDPFELKLKEGEKYDWPAEEEYALIMSTGASAKIHLNGEEIVDRERFIDQLYEVKLNKFTLKQINNQ